VQEPLPAGASLAPSHHSDLPIGPTAPLTLASPSGRIAGPERRVSIDDALRALTIEAAYSRRQQDRIGAIAPGKIANFTVLDDDPYAVEPIKLRTSAPGARCSKARSAQSGG
jgi:predicted amidohydrolase YtcJ